MPAKLHKNAAKRKGITSITGVLGRCGSKEVFLSFASASLLHQLSFADVLDEETGKGYQRRFSEKHSLDFRKYIQQRGSTTIPLTFNLRPPSSNRWRIIKQKGNTVRLEMYVKAGRVLAQVDCQHRLGHLSDLEIPLAFMCFIGLSVCI